MNSQPADPTPAATPEADAILAALAKLRGGHGGRGRRGGLAGDGPAERLGAEGLGAEHANERHAHDGDSPGHGDARHGWRGPWGDTAGAPGAPGHRASGRPPHWAGAGERFGGPALLRLLGTLARASEPLTVSALAELIGVDQPRASRLVQQGVKQGLVVREADPEDARRTRVRLTDTGSAMLMGFRGRQRRGITAALETLTPAERSELARLMTKLADAWQ